MTENWLTQLIMAANSIDQAEQRHTQLSESAAKGLLDWIFNGSDRGSTGHAGNRVNHQRSCVMCGAEATVPMLEDGYEDNGDPLDAWWLCSAHRSALRSVFPAPSSSGRPEMSGHDARVQHYREMGTSIRARRSAAPTPPRMARPGNERPGASAPGMTRPPIFG